MSQAKAPCQYHGETVMRQVQDVILLLCDSDKFLNEVLERDKKLDIQEKRDGQEERREFYNHLISEAEKGRKEALYLILVSTSISFLCALLIKCGCDIFFPQSIPFIKWCIRFASFGVLAFATLNRLKDPKSFDGDTLVEKTNTNLFKFLFCFGFGLNIFTLFLDTLLSCH